MPSASVATPAGNSGSAPAAANNEPFFIVGAPRSGTTLLQSILMGHSRVHIPPETHFIKILVDDIPLAAPLTSEQVHTAVEKIVTHSRWEVMDFPAQDFRASAMALAEPKLADILNLIYNHQLRRAGKLRFADKTPSYIGYIPQLLSIYPGARFIHLIRDGHDVAMSMADMKWGQAYQGHRFAWSEAIQCGSALKNMPFADRILEVRYEAMVLHLETTIRDVCAFLGEQFEPGMLEWHSRVDLSVPAGERWYHQKLYQPILPDAIAVWRRKLSTVECFLMEASLYRDLETANYDLRFGGMFWRPMLWGVGAFMHMLAPLLDRAIPALRRRNYLPRALYI